MGACDERASVPLLIAIAQSRNEEEGGDNQEFTIHGVSYYRKHDVRRAAWLALANLGKRVPLEVFLNFAASIQRRIAYRIGWMDHVPPPLLNMLIELLDYPYEQVKLEAIYALGKIHQPIPEPALHRIAQLRADSQSQAIHQAADEVLAQSGKPQQNT